MTVAKDTLTVRVTHRFTVTPERVYDAFLDPDDASKFLFVTATGQNVGCEIDARVAGEFRIVDRRAGEDVAHRGKYLELDRPRRIVFTYTVPKYGSDSRRVTIDIAPLSKGCEVALTEEMDARHAANHERVQRGWSEILDLAGELLVDEAPTCGAGLAQHAAISRQIGAMFEGLAETFALHREMLKGQDPSSRREDEVYRELAESWHAIAERVQHTAARMAAQHELPMGEHDESAWDERHERAFEKFVRAQNALLARLRVAAERDEAMLASMTGGRP